MQMRKFFREYSHGDLTAKVLSLEIFVLYSMYLSVNMLPHSRMTGTGFIGYLGVGGEYFTVLVTNNHVIQTLDDAKSSLLKFESAFGKGQHCTVKLCDAIADDPYNFWTSSVNEVCCVCVWVCACVCQSVCVCVSVSVA